METSFTFRNLATSDALKSHTLSKLQKLEKYLIKPTNVHVIFNVEKFHHSVELTLNANGVQHVSHETDEDMYASIDKAVTKMIRQLKRYKEQIKDHKKKPIFIPPS